MPNFHFLHVILGMVVLAAVALKARRGGYGAADHVGVETGASHWHMVDLVWLILFPLVYVMPSALPLTALADGDPPAWSTL
jgi:nitric oxide reductase NorE protein